MLSYVQLILNRSKDVCTANVRSFDSEQEAIWSYWADIFQPPSEQQSLIFPSLEDLCLEFSDWGLLRLEANKLRVSILFPCQTFLKTSAEFLPLG